MGGKLPISNHNMLTRLVRIIIMTTFIGVISYLHVNSSCSTANTSATKQRGLLSNVYSNHADESSELDAELLTKNHLEEKKRKQKVRLSQPSSKIPVKLSGITNDKGKSFLKDKKQKSEWSSTWPRVNLKNCSIIEFMNNGMNSPKEIKNGVYPRVGIVSFPGSGNTWVRHLLHQATGLWTGSVYHDRSLSVGGFKGEMKDCGDNSTVAIKAHFPQLDVQRYCDFERIILVVRDPYRAVLAEFNWRATNRHTGEADSRLFKTKVWEEHVISRTNKWLSSSESWLKRFSDRKTRLNTNENPYKIPANISKKLLLVSYERLKRDTTKEMKRVIDFLGLPVYRQQCIEGNATGNFHRVSKSSSSLACLYDRKQLRQEVARRIKKLRDSSWRLNLGDITSEFEGIDEVKVEC